MRNIFTNILYHTVAFLLILLTLTFTKQKFLIKKYVQFIFFVSWVTHLELQLKTYHYTQGHLDFLLLFFRTFIVLHYTFKSVIYFLFICVKNVKSMSGLNFCRWISSFFSTICQKDDFPPLYNLSSFGPLSSFNWCYLSGSVCRPLLSSTDLFVYCFVNTTQSWLLRFVISFQVRYCQSCDYSPSVLCWIFWVFCFSL